VFPRICSICCADASWISGTMEVRNRNGPPHPNSTVLPTSAAISISGDRKICKNGLRSRTLCMPGLTSMTATVPGQTSVT